MIEPYCDSDEEVFWGPVTERERMAVDRLRRKAMTPEELKASINAVPISSNDGEEGLHALAMAAQMLSISHSEDDHEQGRHSTDQEVPQEIANSAISSTTDHTEKQLSNKANEGCPLEMDAVKFLSQRLPEQKNTCSLTDDVSGFFDKTPEHHTSFASSSEDHNGDVAYYLVSSPDTPVALPEVSNVIEDVMNTHGSYENSNNVCKFEIDKFENNDIKVEASEMDHISVGLHSVNGRIDVEDNELDRRPIDHDYFGNNEIKIMPNEIVKIHSEHQLIPYSDDKVEGSNLEPISATDPLTEFKFTNLDWEAATELSKSDFEMKISDNEEELEKAERNLKVEEIIKFLSDEEVKTEKRMESDDFKTLIKNESTSQTCNSEQVDHLKEHIKYEFNLERNELDGCKDFKNSSTKLLKTSEDILTQGICQSNTKSSFTSIKQEKVEQTCNVETKEKVLGKPGLIGGKVMVESLKTEKLKTPCKVQVKFGSDLRKNTITSENSPMTLIGSNKKRQGTPRPAKRSPIYNSQCGIPLAYGNTNGNVDNQKRLGTPRPIKKSPTNNQSAAQSGIPVAQSSSNSNVFKTPTSKPKHLTMVSKIPHLRSPATPSPRANKKFAGVVSPVAQYIHGNPVLLISNNKPLNAPKCFIPCPKKPVSTTTTSERSFPAMAQERDAENIDINNVSGSSLPGNIYYKSALPVQIVSSNSRKFKGRLPVNLLRKNKQN